jgi:DnaD/phage-associated family protein
MSNARFSILQAKAVEDKRISNAQFRTLAALGMYGDKEGWCFPKLKTLAASLGKSKQAVSKDLIELQNLGYLEIRHQYRPDGGMQNSLFRLIFDPPCQPDVDTPSTSLVDTPSTSLVDTPSQPDVDTPSTSEVDALTPHINDPINDPIEVEEPQRPNIYGVYESEIGTLTPMIADELTELEKDYPEAWFIPAVKEAKMSSTRVSLKYVIAILKRWKAEGLPNKYEDKPKSTVSNEDREYVYENRILGVVEYYKGQTLVKTEPIPGTSQ